MQSGILSILLLLSETHTHTNRHMSGQTSFEKQKEPPAPDLSPISRAEPVSTFLKQLICLFSLLHEPLRFGTVVGTRNAEINARKAGNLAKKANSCSPTHFCDSVFMITPYTSQILKCGIDFASQTTRSSLTNLQSPHQWRYFTHSYWHTPQFSHPPTHWTQRKQGNDQKEWSRYAIIGNT